VHPDLRRERARGTIELAAHRRVERIEVVSRAQHLAHDAIADHAPQARDLAVRRQARFELRRDGLDLARGHPRAGQLDDELAAGRLHRRR
jgi:hypothetical protein